MSEQLVEGSFAQKAEAFDVADLERRVARLEDVVSRLIQSNNFVHTKEETDRIIAGEAPFA